MQTSKIQYFPHLNQRVTQPNKTTSLNLNERIAARMQLSHTQPNVNDTYHSRNVLLQEIAKQIRPDADPYVRFVKG